MKLEVGESYLTEDGRIVNIIEKYDNDNYMDADDYFYNEEGVNDFVCSNRNLIAHIPKELHKMICELVNNYHSNNEAIKELEELENRSCSNCKYNYYDKEDAILMCTNEDNNQEYLHNSKMQITLDFYCNKWENKA